ncbi:MAG TPA: 50S ribosomal protein L30 [Chloroflexota bacterium]|nr:50S ribosomal protein L30 [Chloroflexota bacterium]
MPRQLEITYTRSAIGRSERQRRTLEALGLRKLNQTVRRPDNESTRGMVHRIQHLLTWREVEEGNGE